LITRSIASIRCGVLRRCMPTCTTRPCLRAAATIASPSRTSTLIGFCTYTSAPASHAAIIGSACQWSGVPISTTSRSFSFNISR
jgi:hypothetical protein